MSATNNAISIDKLHFGFRRNEFILKELSLEVPEKAIYGFLELTKYCDRSKNVRWKMTGISCPIF